jgi:hypothetical protein
MEAGLGGLGGWERELVGRWGLKRPGERAGTQGGGLGDKEEEFGHREGELGSK